jgi:hypothetical protein
VSPLPGRAASCFYISQLTRTRGAALPKLADGTMAALKALFPAALLLTSPLTPASPPPGILADTGQTGAAGHTITVGSGAVEEWVLPTATDYDCVSRS